MVWNQLRNLTGPKVYDAQKGWGRVKSFRCHIFLAKMSDAEVLCCTWPFCSWLLPAPQSCICYFPLIARANSLVYSLEVQKHTTTLMRGCCNPLILTASMVHKMHPLRPCQNQNKLQQAYLTPLHVLHQILVCSNVVPMSCFAEIKYVSLDTSQTALPFRDLFIPRFSWLGFLPKSLFPKMIVSYVLMGARCLLCSIPVPSLGQIRWKTMKKHTMW